MSASIGSRQAAAERRHPLAGQTMTGADMVIQILADEGVDVLFGYSGGAILPTWDALARYNIYRDSLTRILIEEKLPVEVLSVALVESGFNPLALSPKTARGIWQLMPDTARRYGLTVEPGNDHRTHPEHATRAAARYLQDLYRMFGDWELALAAYNAGEDRVQRAIERAGARDFNELARRKLLPPETRNYVPAVLAAWAQMNSAQTMRLVRKER